MTRPWTNDEIIMLQDPNLSNQFIAVATGRSEAAVRGKRQRLPFAKGSKGGFSLDATSGPDLVVGPTAHSVPILPLPPKATFRGTIWTSPTTGVIYAWTGKKWLNTVLWDEDILGKLGPGPGPVGPAHSTPVDPLQEEAKKVPATFGKLSVEVFDSSGWTRFGLVSDTHLCCKEERLDALHAQYDLFEKEGITTVFHGGNIVDGYIPRINGDSAYATTPDAQAQYVIDHYPHREGIITNFITGDDHESWFCPGLNFGAYLDMLSKRQGRQDLNYIGHVEADIELRAAGFKQVMKIQHPGGGSAYARSYKGQKMVESFQGGEKPAILVQGHYHVSGYSFDRNVHIIGMPGFQDQTVFGRKKHLRFEIGGVILEFKMSPVSGVITRLRPEFTMYFDRGFYKPFLKSDARIIKGHMVIETGK